MRCRNRAAVAATFLTLVICLAAPTAGAEGTRLSLDAGNLGMSAALSAANLVVGEAVPLGGPWSLTLEEQAYVTFPSDTLFAQGGVAALIRFRPWAALGLYVGAGPGLAVYDASALASAGGAAASQQIGVKVSLLAELGWTIDFGTFPLYLEPFVRGFGAAGWDGRTGSAVAPLDAWSAFGGAEGGLRVGWRM